MEADKIYWKHFTMLNNELEQRKYLKPVIDSIMACNSIEDQELKRHALTTVVYGYIIDLINYMTYSQNKSD